MEKAEIVVIGAGPGGYVAAIRAAQLGKKVTIIEEDKMGGICLNKGCIPSKAMIYAATFLDKIKKASEMGIMVQDASLDFEKMQNWKNGILSKLEKGVETLCKGNKITVIKGRATFESSNKLKVTGETDVEFEFEKAIIATGSKPIEIPGFKFDEKTILSSTGALKLTEIPKNLVVIGAGYIGLELGTVYAKLGSKVTVVEMTDQILPGNDKDLAQIVKRNLTEMGVEILLESKANSFEAGKVTIETNDGDKEIPADAVLVAVGRVPNTSDLGLENTKVALDDRGFVKVTEKLQSEDENIFAIGDISSGPMLAHKASHQGKVVSEIISGEREKYDENLVPAVIFTDPEIATVGISEEEAKEKGIEITKGKFPFSVSSRAMTKSETSGFVKIIADKDKEKILGVQIVGADASDLIGEAALAMKKGATVEELAETIHPHPTLSETLQEAAEATLSKATHILNPKV